MQYFRFKLNSGAVGTTDYGHIQNRSARFLLLFAIHAVNAIVAAEAAADNNNSSSSDIFCRAMLCISAAIAVMQCPSVRPSVCHVRGSCQNE